MYVKSVIFNVLGFDSCFSDRRSATQHQRRTEDEGRPAASNLTCLARFATMAGSDSMDGSSVPKSVIQLLEVDGTMMDKGGRAILMSVQGA